MHGGLSTDWLEYDRLLTGHAYGVVEKRKRAILARPWELEPGGGTESDERARLVVEKCLDSFNLNQLQLDLADAIYFGMKPGEIGWKVNEEPIYEDLETISPTGVKTVSLLKLFDSGELIVPKYAFGRPQWQIKFTKLPPKDTRYRADRTIHKQHEVRKIQWHLFETGEPIPDMRVIIHSRGSSNGNPWGRGLKRHLYWPQIIIGEVEKQALIYGDKHASPTPIGYYDQGANPEVLDKLLDGLSQGSWGRLPRTMEVKLLEAARSGGDFYMSLKAAMKAEISFIVLGETGTSDQSGSGGSRARDEVANGVRLETAAADSAEQDDTLNNTLIKWCLNLNKQGGAIPADARCPKFRRQFDEGIDEMALATTNKLIFEVGYKPTPEKITRDFGEGYEPRMPAEAEQLAGAITQQLAAATPLPSAAPLLEPAPGNASSAADVDDAAVESIEQQENAGNFSVEFAALIQYVIRLGDYRIGVEYEPGMVRPQGKRKLRSGYGHLRSHSDQGKSLDAYISAELISAWKNQDDLDQMIRRDLYAIEQVEPETGEFDEYKLMVGFDGMKAARLAYQQEMGAEFVGGLRVVDDGWLEQFRRSPSSQLTESNSVDLPPERRSPLEATLDLRGVGFAASKKP